MTGNRYLVLCCLNGKKILRNSNVPGFCCDSTKSLGKILRVALDKFVGIIVLF